MGPLSQSDGHDPPGLIGELVPSFAAMVDEIVVGFEDAVREPIVAHELPDVFHRVELGGATAAAIATRCRFIASVLQAGRIRPAPLPCSGQTAPKM